LGTLVHRLLEQWDFHLYPENFLDPLRKFCLKELPSDLDDDEKNAFMLEIEDLMGNFLQSASYRELQQATVLGREVPFAMPWSHQGQTGSNSFPCVMEGVMDVVYELAGHVWVGDYKTDRVTAAQLGDYAHVYQLQAQVYAMAASRSLGLNVKGCKLLFLRIGEMVSVMIDVDKFL
jgi:ATP-dependent helicase/nuclease subunit A